MNSLEVRNLFFFISKLEFITYFLFFYKKYFINIYNFFLISCEYIQQNFCGFFNMFLLYQKFYSYFILHFLILKKDNFLKDYLKEKNYEQN
jgi:hypothetical protein